MYIKKIEINSFGGLTNKTFLLDKGFNLIFGDNESGKTTLLSFVLFTFYGIKIKKQPGNMSFKEKYMPWNGMPMQGNITFEYDDEAYCISRLCSDIRNTVSLININTGEIIKDRHILSSPGEYFFGVSAEAFAQSVFFTSGTANIRASSNHELVDMLSGSFENTSSEVSYNRISDILNNDILNLSSPKRKNAVIPKLEAEIYEINKRQSRLERSLVNADNVKREIKRIEQEIEDTEAELRLVKSDVAENNEDNPSDITQKRNFLILSLIILALTLSIAFFVRNVYIAACFSISVVFFFASVLVFLVSKKKEERRALRKVFTLQQNNDKIIVLTQRIIELNSSKMQYMDMLGQNSALDIEMTQLNDRLCNLEDELVRSKDELRALEIAKEALDNAYNEFKTVFSPQLSSLTADYFSRITMEKYHTVSVNDSFDISVSGAYGYKSVGYLSHGCAEQAYLAMRLALSEIVLSKQKTPIFFDDAFAFYDDKRLNSTIEFLIELSKDKQIIFSTCRNSEYSLITKHNANVLYF